MMPTDGLSIYGTADLCSFMYAESHCSDRRQREENLTSA
jgi:hypothetical protein